MINRLALGERVREWGLSEEVVEKDYVLGWVLSAIGRHPVLGAKWVFKGGTCLKKCYIETYRFSEDLDFTVVPDGPIRAGDLAPILSDMLPRLTDDSGIDWWPIADLIGRMLRWFNRSTRTLIPLRQTGIFPAPAASGERRLHAVCSSNRV